MMSFFAASLGMIAAASPEAGAEGHGATLNVGDAILRHIVDSDPIAFGITKGVLLMLLAALIVIVGIRRAVGGYDADGVPRTRWAQMLDPFAEHFHRDIAQHYIGEKWAGKVTPLLLTFFFFILTCNLLGLVPLTELVELGYYFAGAHPPEVLLGGGTATANWNVTLTLAALAFVSIIVYGSMKHGVVGHFSHLAPSGMHWLIRWPLLLPIEIISMFVKPVALTMRLAANMSGGHIAILAVLFIPVLIKSALVGIPGMAIATGILLLEVIVCFVQAYVFALLTGVFIGLAIHVHH
ncbi:MAG: F0F1 ATP synthase subunit A [Acidobacteriota bacterium]